jgi:hypothetical protein
MKLTPQQLNALHAAAMLIEVEHVPTPCRTNIVRHLRQIAAEGERTKLAYGNLTKLRAWVLNRRNMAELKAGNREIES